MSEGRRGEGSVAVNDGARELARSGPPPPRRGAGPTVAGFLARPGRKGRKKGPQAFGITLGILLAVSPAPPLLAQTDTLALSDCVSIALERNPLVHSAQEQVQASLARIRKARALPQPTLDIDSDLQPGMTDFRGSEERYVGLSQTVPFPGRTWLQGKVAREESNEVVADRDLLRLDITYQVTTAFYDILLAREQLEYARQNEGLAADFVSMTEMKFQAGDLAQVEVVRARVEEARARSAVRAAENEVRLALARMNFLLARGASDPLAVEGALRNELVTPDPESLTRAALEARPEMQRVNASIARESLKKTQGYLSYFPDFDVGVAQHRQTGLDNTWDVTLSLSLPVFFWQPVRGEIAEAGANERAFREEAVHVANAISLEVQEAVSNLTMAAEQIRLFEDGILGQAEEAYRMYQFSFEQGEIDALDLIEARRTLNEARTSYADALYTYDVVRAAAERAVGRPIQEQDHVQDPPQMAPIHDSTDPPPLDELRAGFPPGRDGADGGFRHRRRLRRGAGAGGR